MSFQSRPDDDDHLMSEINMTPLVDIMLVLLVVFMITIPAIQHSVKLDLPRTPGDRTNNAGPSHINLSIRADGRILWNGVDVPFAGLSRRIADASGQHPRPELHLYADRRTPYEHIAQVMAVAQAGGLTRIGFMTDDLKPGGPANQKS